MPNNIQDKTFRDLINLLFDEQEARWSSEKNPNISSASLATRELLEPIIGWKEIKNSEQLPTKNVGCVNFNSETQSLMRFPPLEKDSHLVPWISISYNYSDGDFKNACCKIRVYMLGKKDSEPPFGIGFRIESPEKLCQVPDNDMNSENEIGRHDFYHAQLLKGFSENGITITSPEWLPETQPSFPLWAMNPVDALLGLILTLYGARFYKDFLKRHGSTVSQALSPEFKQLNTILSA